MLTGTLTAPAVALTVPCALIAAENTGKPMACSPATSRTPPVVTRPRTPRWASEVASNSPNAPSVDGDEVVTTRKSPAQHCSTAAWIMRLSPGQHSAVTAVPPTRMPGQAGRMPVPRYPDRPVASCTVATPNSASTSTASRSARGQPVTTTALTETLSSIERLGSLRVDAHVSLGHCGVRQSQVRPGVAAKLDATSFGQLGVVVPHVHLGGQALHRRSLGVKHVGDVEQHVRLEIALLRLVRLEQEHRRSAQRFTRRVVSDRL